MCSALGALVIASGGLAPAAAASDIQSKQWYLKAMGADEIWKYSTGKGVKVAVIDSGVNPATPSLKGQVLVKDVPKSVAYHATRDYDGHGTGMAEIIAGTGAGGGVKGLAPGAKIVPYRIYGASLKDPKEAEKSPNSTAAIRAAADSDAKIINMSFGSPYYNTDEEAAIKYAASKGKLMFASIGNSGAKSNKKEYPVVDPHVVGVAAIDESGTVAKFSTHGNYVDLAAPGIDVPGWCDNTFTEYCATDGTSPASAIASASAALIWSAHPDWTANQVLRSLIDTAARTWPKDKPGTYLGYGVVRPRRVLINKNIDPGPANVDPLAKENGTADGDGEDAKSSPTRSAKPSAGEKAGGQTSAAARTQDSGDGTRTWVTIGAAAAVLLIAGAGFAVLRARRNA
ncbi:S8 family serine peptidase [Streptomyces sp. DSM 110735]|uniref:S8 family serine peptidase n=1 Tax=Streptomyces sp. DSM 110735 TaxID=2775031 RepID=UPI0018F2E55F|nr:S8 family serine peptidase [Streptomyces sp. DSM 110735]MBJ7907520.1 S8 family serine peptidase [Streptomyces sp. DSM 110735]